MKTEFGEILSGLREKSGELFVDMARRLEITCDYLCYFETGRIGVPVAVVKDIIKLYGLDKTQADKLIDAAKKNEMPESKAKYRSRPEGCEDLYIAIWQQAIRDEQDKAETAASNSAFTNAYEDYCNSVAEPIKAGSKAIKKIKQEIRNKANESCEAILMPLIKKLLIAETKEWPNNDYKIIKDPEYKALFVKLKKETLEYARERFGQLSEDEALRGK